jgi:hypothetical protein
MAVASLVSTAAVVVSTTAQINTTWSLVSTAAIVLALSGALHKQNVLGPIGTTTIPWFDFPT